MTKTLTLPSAAPVAALVESSIMRRSVAIAVGSLTLALSAQMTVPMFPVPMTMQTFAVIMIGALCGGRLAVEIVVAYLIEGAVGLPVFAKGASGLAYMMGTTGGYLAGFVVAAAVIGYFTDRGWNKSWMSQVASLVIGLALIFLLGVGWLASFIGFDKALYFGFTVFALGEALKIALAALSLRGVDSIAKSSLFGRYR